MAFYSDYIRNLERGNHIVLIVLANGYLQYGSWGYERFVDYSEIVSC